MRPMHRLPRTLAPAALAVALGSLAAGAGPASAYGTRSANFRATISGSYANDGTVTSRGCFRYDPDGGDRIRLPDSTGEHSERTTFRSTGSVLFGISKTDGERRIVAGGKAIPVKVRTTRRSELANPFEVRGCTPLGDQFDTKCGTRTKRFRVGVFGRSGRPAISWGLSDRFTIKPFDDPFESCPIPESTSWWGGDGRRPDGNGDARFKTSRVFNRHVKELVLHGRTARDTKGSGDGFTAKGHESLRWTLVLRRVP